MQTILSVLSDPIDWPIWGRVSLAFLVIYSWMRLCVWAAKKFDLIEVGPKRKRAMTEILLEDQNGKIAKVLRPAMPAVRGYHSHVPLSVLVDAKAVYNLTEGFWLKNMEFDPNMPPPWSLEEYLRRKNIKLEDVPEAEGVHFSWKPPGSMRFLIAFEHKPSGFYCGSVYVKGGLPHLPHTRAKEA